MTLKQVETPSPYGGDSLGATASLVCYGNWAQCNRRRDCQLPSQPGSKFSSDTGQHPY